MKRIKPKYKRILILSVLIAVLVCTCPLPRRIEFDASGARVKMDSNEISTYDEGVDVEIEGWYYQFLFFDDFMNVSVHIEDAQGEYQFDIEHRTLHFYEQDGIQFTHVSSAYWEGASLKRVSILGKKPWQDVVVEIEGAQESEIFAASESGQTSLQLLLEEYCRLDVFNNSES